MAKLATTVGRWGLCVLWAVVPLVAGPSFADALDATEAPFRTAVSAGLWVIWVVTLTASLVPRTVTLTAVRLVVPASPFALTWATVAGDDTSILDAIGLAVVIAAAVVAMAPATGWVFVNGSSYGAERRFPLRAPGLLVLGPIELAWAVAVIGACAGPLWLAEGSLLLGAATLLVGWPLSVAAVRSLHVLARRWLVFTQAGLVLVDPLGLADALLMVRRHITDVGPAPRDTDALDLTAGALGLALEVGFREPQPVTPAPPRRPKSPPETVEADRVLFTPTRPGALLAEAAERRLPLG